jgi:hypothetical protein
MATRIRRPKKPKVRGRSVKTYKLTNIERPSSTKMKPLSSRAVVTHKRSASKRPHQKGVKYVSTPETKSIEHAKERAARSARTSRHEQKIKTEKLTNIAVKSSKPAKSSSKGDKPPKWFS